MRTAVVTDSTARPVAPAVAVVDLDVVVDGVPASEAGTDLDALLARMTAGAQVGTSRPSPDGFARAYAAAAASGASAVVSVHLSGALSGTVEAARLAAAGAPLRVEVVDTGCVGAALTAAVGAAAEAAADGADVRRVAALAAGVAGRSRTWFSPATSAHLTRGGRAAGDGGRPGLSARPVLLVHDGRLVPLERLRTTGRVLDRLVALAADRLRELAAEDGATAGGHVEVVVQHAGATGAAEDLQRRLRDGAVGVVPVRVRPLSPVLAAHVGPGAVGLAVLVTPGR
ncbi:DegV family protein [Aquipuribacter hungaricus]|uniref:DegV family protein n=1 Tax=Aquipuribacter hungaricus TaxID=545624 RepID=A0ABV7WFW1_9MICO